MKAQLPEFLLCEDPTAPIENLFIYHVLTGSLIHIVHTDTIDKDEADELSSPAGRHFDYTYTNAMGKTERIMFVAEIVDPDVNNEQWILERCAHWYACYLGWEQDCDDVIKHAS